MGKRLRPVHRQNVFNRLEFQQNGLLHDEVSVEATIDTHALIDNRNRNLAFECQAGMLELPAKALVLNGFEQARTELAVDLYGKTDDPTGQAGFGFGWVIFHGGSVMERIG